MSAGRTTSVDAQTLRDALERLRRRCRLVDAVAYTAIAAIVVAALAVPAFASLTPGTAARLIAALAGAGVVTAAFYAAVRTPILRRIAAVADARLSLDDCLVTALQHIDDRDVVSRLLVRAAAARAASAQPAVVFPFRMPARAGGTALVAVGLAALATAIASRVPQERETYRAAAAPASAPAGTMNEPVSSRPESPGSDPRSSVGRSADRLARENEPAAIAGEGGGLERGGREAAPSARGAETSSADARSASAARGTGVTSAGQPSVAPSLSARTAPAGRGLPGAGAAAARGGSTAAAGAGGPLSDRSVEGGGAGGTRAGGTDRVPPRGDYAARYRESAARAESALAQERLPPGMRAYVRAYFDAIHPR